MKSLILSICSGTQRVKHFKIQKWQILFVYISKRFASQYLKLILVHFRRFNQYQDRFSPFSLFSCTHRCHPFCQNLPWNTAIPPKGLPRRACLVTSAIVITTSTTTPKSLIFTSKPAHRQLKVGWGSFGICGRRLCKLLR